MRLFDFGLAREVDGDSLDNRTGGVAGSCGRGSPEVALGQGRCFGGDVCSCGTALWELLTLEKPFEKIGPLLSSTGQGVRLSLRGIPAASLRNLLKHVAGRFGDQISQKRARFWMLTLQWLPQHRSKLSP